jgi:hypothetical protein
VAIQDFQETAAEKIKTISRKLNARDSSEIVLSLQNGIVEIMLVNAIFPVKRCQASTAPSISVRLVRYSISIRG